MIFSIGAVMIVLGYIVVCYVSPWITDWRDYTAMSLVCIGIVLSLISLLEFASRYLI